MRPRDEGYHSARNKFKTSQDRGVHPRAGTESKKPGQTLYLLRVVDDPCPQHG